MIKTLCYKSVGGANLLLDLYYENTSIKGCIAFLHGGALLLGSRKDIPLPIISFLNNEGWTVASIDYRLFPTSLNQILEDIQDACQHLKDRFPSLPLILSGYSAGAYLSLLAATSQVPVDGVCAFAGYSNFLAPWFSSPSKFFLDYKDVSHVPSMIETNTIVSDNDNIDLYIYLRQKGLWPEYILGKTNFETIAKKFSPLYHLSGTVPPIALIHGNLDGDVPCDASVEFANALAEFKLPHKLSILPGLDHDLYTQIENSDVKIVWRKSLEFLLNNLPNNISNSHIGNRLKT